MTIWIVDTEPIYRLWCIAAGHRWRRIAYTLEWVKPKSCHRCADIARPPARRGDPGRRAFLGQR